MLIGYGIMPKSDTDLIFIYMIYSFIICFALTSITFSVVESCVTTFFVCFATDSSILSQTNPQAYTKIIQQINQQQNDNHLRYS